MAYNAPVELLKGLLNTGDRFADRARSTLSDSWAVSGDRKDSWTRSVTCPWYSGAESRDAFLFLLSLDETGGLYSRNCKRVCRECLLAGRAKSPWATKRFRDLVGVAATLVMVRSGTRDEPTWDFEVGANFPRRCQLLSTRSKGADGNRMVSSAIVKALP